MFIPIQFAAPIESRIDKPTYQSLPDHVQKKARGVIIAVNVARGDAGWVEEFRADFSVALRRSPSPTLAIHIAEKYTNVASQRPDYRGGLPIARLRKIEDYVRVHLAESISIETLAELAELSPFHFSRVFKQATGITPLQFVTRERMLQAQQLIRETSRSLIEIALEVGYTSPSHFAQVFRRTAGMAPRQFRNAL